MSETSIPKVFISYSWSSPKHEKSIIEIATKLMSDGVEVILDKWDLREGQDLNVFMEQMVTDDTIIRVLIFIDRRYAEKADGREGGVGTESQIISGKLYKKVDETKFIPIVMELDKNGEPYLPTFLKTRKYIDLSKDSKFYAEYDQLLRNIYNKPLYPKPSLGTPPKYISSEELQSISTLHQFQAAKDAITSGSKFSLVPITEFYEKMTHNLKHFALDPESSSDDLTIEKIEEFKPYRDQFIDITRILCLSNGDIDSFATIFSFFEQLMNCFYPPPNTRYSNEMAFEHYRFIALELFLYTISITIKYKNYSAYTLLTEDKYIINNGIETTSCDYCRMNHRLRGLDEVRNTRLELRRVSITADLLKERADFEYIDFENIMQSDFLLCLKGAFSGNINTSWFPRTLVYRSRAYQPFEIFLRAESDNGMKHLGKLINIANKEELKQKFLKAKEMHYFDGWTFDGWPINYASCMNFESLFGGES